MKYIHIAGTNGKGSTAEYISNIIMAQGKSCGCFTSPHLVSPTERIRINGKRISERKLSALMSEVEERNLAVNETQFAKYTAAALAWFERKNLDYAVIETGLGGRLDPTNVIKAAIFVLTPISFDHTKILGNSIKEIAGEKCGIIKDSAPVISAQQCDEAKEVIESRCANMCAPLMYVDDVQKISASLHGQTFAYKGKHYDIQSIGQWQPQNAALAIETAMALGFTTKSIAKGLRTARIKSRTEYIAGRPPMLIDGAHNPSSISMLMETLEQHFSNQPKVLLFACMSDKDYPAMIDLLGDAFLHVVVVNVDVARGADVHELQKLFSKYTVCQIENDVQSGFKKAKSIAISQGALLVVCGSFYLAGSKFIK